MPGTETETTLEEEQKQQANDAAKKFKTVLLQTLSKKCEQDNWADHGRTIGVSLPLQNLAEWGTWAIDFQFESKGKKAPYCAMLRFEMKEDTNLESCLRGLQLFYLYNKNDQSPEWSKHNNWNLKLFVEYHESLKRNNWQNIDPNDLADWIIVQKKRILKKINAQPDIHNLLDNEPPKNARRDAAKWYLINKGEYNEDIDTEDLLNIYEERIKNDLNVTAKNLRNKQADGKPSKDMNTNNELWWFSFDCIKDKVNDEAWNKFEIQFAKYREEILTFINDESKEELCKMSTIRAGLAQKFALQYGINDKLRSTFKVEGKDPRNIKVTDGEGKPGTVSIPQSVNAKTFINTTFDLFKENYTEEKPSDLIIIFKCKGEDAEGFMAYMKELIGEENIHPYHVPHNRIVFGAPGTGKSWKIKNESTIFENRITRVTFHPEYSYYDFVGSYKPVMTGTKIGYGFVPGPFASILREALNNPDTDYCLIIEEINRARVAAVFGDIFQLLDRDKSGNSEYRIKPSKELAHYLATTGDEKGTIDGDKLKDYESNGIYLPSNLYIWATMNSADQGVYPLDTAFKRRWSMEYLSINEGAENDSIGWNTIRKGINDLLKPHVNEDKLMGYYFLKEEERDTEEHLKEALAGKVLMYLFDDAAKPCRKAVFKEINKARIYSDLREKMSLSESNLGIFTGSEFWPGQQEQRAGGNVQNETHTEEAETDVEQQ